MSAVQTASHAPTVSSNAKFAAQQTKNARLFSERQIAVASYLASPVAGTALFAWNAALLNRTGAAAGAVAGGVAVTILMAIVGQLLPIHLGGLLALGVAMGLRKLTLNTFETELQQRRESGKGWQSNWTATGVALACLAAVVGVVLLVV